VAVAQHPDRLTWPPARRAFARGRSGLLRRFRDAEVTWLVVLMLLTVTAGVALALTLPGATVAHLAIPMVLANIVLGPRTLPWFVLFVLGVVVVGTATSAQQVLDTRRVGAVTVTFAIGMIIMVSSFRRTQLGVAGGRSESMLVDLRDRIVKQGALPSLPESWYVESVMQSAGGSSFAGDFVVASRGTGDQRLEVAVVDVSGKGAQAGTRSLLLSGAFGGLLGALPPAEFLPAANDYLLRQDWEEGFATAVHLSIDLRTGIFELRSAGHPPAVQLHAGSGRWAVHEVDGPVLGLMAGARFDVRTGRLLRGDALLLYTDGLVETPRRDISLGIDKLLGQGEALLRSGFEGGANRLIERVGSSVDDDRALLLLHRR
jgi:hypothetical protein